MFCKDCNVDMTLIRVSPTNSGEEIIYRCPKCGAEIRVERKV
ncbi:MAG: hypothetical protein RRY40_00155 [Oscillospiraceae bacterium]